MRAIGPGGLALLREFEVGPDGGPAPEPYDAHDGHTTIGYGHVVTGREPFDCSGAITDDQIEWLLAHDTAWAAAAIEHAVTVELSQNEFDALSCWCFGVGQRQEETSTLIRELDVGLKADVPTQLRRWNRVEGVVWPGLVRRREAEVALWSAP